jgi:hypothetical protein
VEVQVLGAQVGEDRQVEGAPADSVEGQGVGGDLEYGRSDARVDRFAQERLNADRLRCGVVQVVGAADRADLDVDRSQPGGRVASRLEDRRQQLGCAGLTVSSGDPDQGKLTGWMPEQGGGEVSQDGPGTPRLDLETSDAGCGGQWRLGRDGNGAALQGLLDEGAAVTPEAWDCDEQVARYDPSRVEGDSGQGRSGVTVEQARVRYLCNEGCDGGQGRPPGLTP